MPLSHADVRRILEILDGAQHLESLDLTVGEFRLQARKSGAAVPLSRETALADHAAALPASASDAGVNVPVPPQDQLLHVPAGLIAVRAPMVGTFYLRPSPDQPPFVTPGAAVNEGDTVCLVEVMKMFNSIRSEVSGTVERIVVENGKPVQHEQIVMLIKPGTGA